MRNIFIFFMKLAILFLFTACTLRTYTIEKPRTDLDIKGNQGYILGTPPRVGERPVKKRKITVLEIELGPIKEEVLKREKPEVSREEKIQEEVSPEQEILEEEPLGIEAVEVPEEELEEEVFSEYKIQKGDTLQKISYKFYGTHRRWKKIFEANKEILKDPNKLIPGQVIKIPR